MTKAQKTTVEKDTTKRIPRKQRELQMLEVAAAEFGQRGYDATSMDDIAKACGITKPMLYNYFKSKEGLYAAMITQAGTHLVKALIAVREQTDPGKRLHEALAVFLDFVERYHTSWRMVFSGDGKNSKKDGENSTNIAGYRHQILLAATYTLAEFRPDTTPPKLAEKQVLPYAYGLLGAGEAIANWWLSTPDVDSQMAKHAIGKIIDANITLVKRELNKKAAKGT